MILGTALFTPRPAPTEALFDSSWRSAMKAEFDAL
jgi:hypothetical protein